MNLSHTKMCPLEDAYIFLTSCTITTCKYHSTCLTDNCMVLSGAIPENRTVTDAELLQYKFNDTDLSEKDVCNIRKRSVDRVRYTVQLYRLIFYIRDNFVAKEDFAYDKESIIGVLTRRKPLSIHRLGFEPWMLIHMLDEQFVASICGPKFNIKSALLLKQKEYACLIQTITHLQEKSNAN